MDSTCRMHEQHEERLKRLEQTQNATIDNLQMITKIEVTLEQIREDVKEIKRDIKENNETHNLRMKEMDKRIARLENRPGEIALSYWKFILSALGTGILGYVLKSLLG